MFKAKDRAHVRLPGWPAGDGEVVREEVDGTVGVTITYPDGTRWTIGAVSASFLTALPPPGP